MINDTMAYDLVSLFSHISSYMSHGQKMDRIHVWIPRDG
jgi:hypothetical protein